MKKTFPFSTILIALLIGFMPQLILAGHPHDEELPHHDDPAPVQHEHLSLFDLVEHHDATHRSIQSESMKWSDPLTWENGEIPSEIDGELPRVVISANTEVILDFINTQVHKTIRVDGKLTFSTETDTELLVDTCVVDPDGILDKLGVSPSGTNSCIPGMDLSKISTIL